MMTMVIETLKGVVNDDKFPARLVVTYSFGLSKLQRAGAGKTSVGAGGKRLGQAAVRRREIPVGWLEPGIHRPEPLAGLLQGRDQGNGTQVPEQIKEGVLAFHRAGIQIHCHCNGNLAVEMFIDAVDNALQKSPRWDHRHTVDHCQTATQAQFRRIKALDMCVNLFANHIYFWG